MRSDNLAYDFLDGSEVSTDTAENKTLSEMEQNKEDCNYIFQQIYPELVRRHYKCEISGGYPFNITVSAPSKAYPSIVILRHRTGRFIAGPVGGVVGRGPNISNDDLPISRSHDREEVLDYVERYVELTSPHVPQSKAQEDPEPHEELKPSGTGKLKWLLVAMAILAMVVGAKLIGMI